MNNDPIGFFDSGIGLFSILAETKKILPLENFVIFADQGHNPYGEKSPKQIRKYTRDATDFLIRCHSIKMMVLACNTATVLAINSLRRNFTIPIVGTVPAVKPAFKGSEDTRVAIMSTPATAKSQYLASLIKDFGNSPKTLKVGCAGLEEAIEGQDEEKIKKTLDVNLSKIKKFNPDIVVLGCTHYPLIKNKIKSSLPRAKIIDSGKAIAKRIKKLLEDSGSASNKRTADFYYTTASPQFFSKVVSTLIKKKVTAQKAVI